MAIITDFAEFLDQADVDGYEEAYALHTAVTQCTDMSSFECVEAPNGKWIVSSPIADDKLLLASLEARSAFLSMISKRYIDDDDLDMEGWYSYKRAMEKDDENE